MISDLPTMHEVVMGVDNEPTNEGTPNNSSKSNKSPSQPVQFHGTIKFKCIYKPCKHHNYFQELRNIRRVLLNKYTTYIVPLLSISILFNTTLTGPPFSLVYMETTIEDRIQ